MIKDTKGILNDVEYQKQSLEINTKLSKLKRSKKKLLANSDCLEQINNLKYLKKLIMECKPDIEFDRNIFEQIVECIKICSDNTIEFKLLGDLVLTEKLYER